MGHFKLRASCLLVLGWIGNAFIVHAQTFTKLVDFTGPNGAMPYLAPLVQGTDGNLYGTAEGGGSNGNFGTVFKISPAGALKTIHQFQGVDGSLPYAGVIEATDGNLYGTTAAGGTYDLGTVFRLNSQGQLKTLAIFNGANGSVPQAGLVEATDGNFYGSTYAGGTNDSGTLFKLTPDGTLTILYNFAKTDGANPIGTLIQGHDGNLYGTANSGGTGSEGTVFKLTLGGALTTLYNFCQGCQLGDQPIGPLLQGLDGNFYGTTTGASVFRITPSGTLKVIYDYSDLGSIISGGLVQASDGNFYSTLALAGGKNPYHSGGVFELTPAGAFTFLYTFSGDDGEAPHAGLLQSTNGTFYGTTSSGGQLYLGTLYSLSTGLGPFIKLLPTAAHAGSTIRILGTSLTGATGVLFSGKSASFTILSASEITATVPAGAASGTVQVVTNGGTLLSNPAFQVLP